MDRETDVCFRDLRKVCAFVNLSALLPVPLIYSSVGLLLHIDYGPRYSTLRGSQLSYVIRILRIAFVYGTGLVLLPAARGFQPDAGEKLRLVVVLSRHGIRPPLAPAATLSLRSANPWPDWEVPPGHLTPHGALALREMGAYMRSDLAANGLLPATGCHEANKIYLYSDSDERNIDSTHNTFADFMPDCAALPVHTMIPNAGTRDPLFFPIPGTFPAPLARALAQERQNFLRDRGSPFYVPNEESRLKELAQVLSPEGVSHATNPILEEPSPLTVASPLIEDIFLEYADGKPMSDVGWGRINETFLRQLIPLHVREFASKTRTPLAAVTQGSNLVAHILATLEQAAGQTGNNGRELIATPIGPEGALLVYISGHDTNLFNVGGILDLNWTVEAITDDTPPDSQIVFELWQDHESKEYTVQIHYRAQSIDQLRRATQLTPISKPADVQLTPPGCRLNRTCSFATFDQAARARLDPAYVK